MKKTDKIIYSIFVATATALLLFPSATHANSFTVIEEKTEHLHDGSYYVSRIYTEKRNYRLYSPAKRTQHGHKTVTFYSPDKTREWSLTTHGTFTYNGSSASCTSCTATKTIYNPSWKVSIISVKAAGNRATSTARGKYYRKNMPVQSKIRSASLRCSANGT